MATFFSAIRSALAALLKAILSGLTAFIDGLLHPLRWPGTLWRWGRVLWVCRIAVVSGVGGGLLLAATPQARDCFSDLGLSAWQWALFLALTFAWAWIVHASARRALLADDWVPDAHCGGLSDPQRNVLRNAYAAPALVVPRLLGFSVLGFVFVALYRARANLSTATGGLTEAAEAVWQIDQLIVAMIGVTVIYLLWVWMRRIARQRIVGGPGATPVEPTLLTGVLPFPLSWRATPHGFIAPVLTRIEIALSLIGIGITFFFIYSFMFPHDSADMLPRVLVVPVLFGGFVLILSEVAMWSMRLRTPFLLLLTLLSGVFLFFADHFHDVRFVDAAGPASPMRGGNPQIHFSDAVERWRHINEDCNPDAADPKQKCPRPILIAGAGGASRAAFMTATVVGALIDLGRADEKTYGNVRNR